MRTHSTRKPYPTDLTDAQWEILAPLIPEVSPNTTQETIRDANSSMACSTSCERAVRGETCHTTCPTERPSTTISESGKTQGIWENAMTTLRKQTRQSINREEEPSAAIIDSQSIKTSAVRGSERGFDAGKKNLGSQASYLG